MLIADKWKEYEILDAGDGEKLEKWANKFILSRPDPEVIWPKEKPELWSSADASYVRSTTGGGSWKFKNKLPEKWEIDYGNLKFIVKPTEFKHTGLFPEQASNWDWLREQILNSGRKINLLNLFAYTGAATVACLSAGASVCHVDASKGINSWAKENVALNGLETKPVRFIVDDVLKFVEKEKRRNKKYDGIIMDPPSFGRGTKGETWKIENLLWPLVKGCVEILSNDPLFFVINSYTAGLSQQVSANVLDSALGYKPGGKISSYELGLAISKSKKILPAGSTARWSKI